MRLICGRCTGRVRAPAHLPAQEIIQRAGHKCDNGCRAFIAWAKLQHNSAFEEVAEAAATHRLQGQEFGRTEGPARTWGPLRTCEPISRRRLSDGDSRIAVRLEALPVEASFWCRCLSRERSEGDSPKCLQFPAGQGRCGSKSREQDALGSEPFPHLDAEVELSSRCQDCSVRAV